MALISLFSDPIFDTELMPLGFSLAEDSDDAHRHSHDRHRKRHSHDRDLLKAADTAPMDIVETATSYELHADAPGMGPEDVKVELQDGVLMISGSHKSHHESKDARGRLLLRRERTAYSFSRAFSLPENANPDGITAAMDKGVLVVTVPKRAPHTVKRPAPKRIAVAPAPAAKL